MGASCVGKLSHGGSAPAGDFCTVRVLAPVKGLALALVTKEIREKIQIATEPVPPTKRRLRKPS